MARKILYTLLIGLAASVAGSAWLFVEIAGMGVNPLAVVIALNLFGVVPAAIVGAAMGLLLRGRLSAAPIAIGWLVSLWLTPPGFALMNPANAHASMGDKALAVGLLVLYYLTGALCTYACSRRNRNSLNQA